MLLSLEEQEKFAQKLALEHQEAEPRLLKVLWFPDKEDGDEIRLIEELDAPPEAVGLGNASSGGQVDLLSFPMNALKQGVSMVIGDIWPGQKSVLREPYPSWGSWNQGQVVWARA
jgi:hypothetical protein